MLHAVLVIVGMELILLISVATLTFHRRLSDILIGRYVGNSQGDAVMSDLDSDRLDREQQARSLSRADLLISAPGRGEQTRAALPDGIRIYAVGDVHGRSDLLERLLAAIDADCKQRPIASPITVFLGDYIDRGSDSQNVLNLLLQWRQHHEAIFLSGNHETFLPRFLADPRSLNEWRQYGGLETLLSYGLKPTINPDHNEEIRLATELANILPREHLDFLKSLDLSFSCGDFLFVHAGVRPCVPIHEQTEEDLLWIRDDFLTWKEPFERFVVHGHTPVSEPDLRPNRINIDTGAYATGRLTCVIIENTAITELRDSAGVQIAEGFSAPSMRALPDPARA